jgi:hypothetical protein
MRIREISIAGYRSLRAIRFPGDVVFPEIRRPVDDGGCDNPR